MNKRKIVIGAISLVVLVTAVAVILNSQEALVEALGYIKSANPWILLLLVPNIILMYYAAGRIWYPYLKHKHISALELTAVHYELNFVNTAVPSLALSGLVYATERLRKFDVDPGYTGVLYIYRYVVSITTNWIGIIGSIIILACLGKMHDMPIVPLIIMAIIIFIAVFAFVVIVMGIAGKARFKNQRINSYFCELRAALKVVQVNRRALLESWIWGMLYTVLEDLPFFVVAWAMGHPELFLQMVVAAAAGIIIGVVTPTPGGIGGFDGAMIYLLGGFGTNVALASAIVLTARILVLVSTTATGYPFWQRGMIKIGQTKSSAS